MEDADIDVEDDGRAGGGIELGMMVTPQKERAGLNPKEGGGGPSYAPPLSTSPRGDPVKLAALAQI